MHVTKTTSHLSLNSFHTHSPFISFLPSLSQITHTFSMADLNQTPPQPYRSTTATSSSSAVFLRKLQENLHAPNSTQLAGILTLLVIGSIFLLLTSLTVAATVLSLIFFSPLIIFSSPIWVPAGTFFFLLTAGFLSMCGFGVIAAVASSWMYRYYRGLHPPGSDRFDYARNRLYDTATHVTDCAKEYGGYLQNKVKDAAPGA